MPGALTSTCHVFITYNGPARWLSGYLNPGPSDFRACDLKVYMQKHFRELEEGELERDTATQSQTLIHPTPQWPHMPQRQLRKSLIAAPNSSPDEITHAAFDELI